MEQYMIWVWLGVFVITLFIEAITQDIVSIWFSIGALAALCISSFTEIWVQIVVFAIISLATLILTRPVVKKIMGRGDRKTNIDEIFGKKYVVIKDITKYEAGEIKVNGIIFNAVLEEANEETITKDSIVKVIAIKGNKMVVKKVEE